jgi:biotin carboxylase
VKSRIAILHHPLSFAPFELLQQLDGYTQPLWVLDAEVAEEGLHKVLERSGPVITIAGLDLDEAAAAIDRHDPDGIVSYVDDHLVTAAELAARLGLRYHTPGAARVLMDKRLQAAALDDAGIPGPAFRPLRAGATREDVRGLTRSVTYPAVLKPAEGSGSRGIYLAHDPGELELLLADTSSGHIVEEYLADAPVSEPWLASYLSVESVVSAGHQSHVAITGRFPLAMPFRETGNFIPGILAPDLEGPVFEIVTAALEALHVRDAVVHTEIKLTDRGPKLVEVNGRLGGRPPFVLRSVSDVNLFAATCDVAAGIPVRYAGPAPCRAVGFWLMVQPPTSAVRVSAVHGLDHSASIPGISTVDLHAGPGEPVDWRNGTASKVVTVRGTAPNHHTLGDTIARIHRAIDIDYEYGDGSEIGTGSAPPGPEHAGERSGSGPSAQNLSP